MGLFSRSRVLGAGCLVFLILLILFCFPLVSAGGRFIVEWSLIRVGLDVSFPVIFDRFRILFSLVVLLISFFVLVFSTSYIDSEENLSRFIWLVILFVLSINFLIFVPRIIGAILGWDGLGLISFLLVIYYQNTKSLGAGMVTAFINRVGDALLLLSIALLRSRGHWYVWGVRGYGSVWIIFLFVVLLSTTKSAQFPFSYWLPAAIRAPTPVSALVHSSTLVTAGVYLLIRVTPNFIVSRGRGCWWLLVVSIFTICIAGVRAYYEVDIKKVVALSTLSQLGVIMFSLRLGFYSLAFFHLVSHALFKALLFIRVGCIIHNHCDWQDFRSIRGLWSKIPLARGCVILAGIALRGLPFLGGFYSKDLVVERFLGGQLNWFIIFVVRIGLGTTLIYRLRLYFGGVSGLVRQGPAQFVENLTLYEVIPIVCIGVFSVCGGYFMQSFVFGFNEIFLLEFKFKSFLFFLLWLGVFFVLFRVMVKFFLFKVIGFLKSFLLSFFCTMWFSLHGVSMFNKISLGKSGLVYNRVDLGWNEYVLGGLGLFDGILGYSSSILRLWRGSLGFCVSGAGIILGLLVIIIWFGV